MRLNAYPVIGPLSANPVAIKPPTDFLSFEASCGVHGLAYVNKRVLHLLSVVAVTPGVGQFRNFMDQCKRYYEFIRLWAVMNDELRRTLIRYGFKQSHDVDKFGEMQEVWDWQLKTAKEQDHTPCPKTAASPAGGREPAAHALSRSL